MDSFRAFAALGTQWRPGPMSGFIGLDYNAIPAVLRLLQIKRAAWPDIFEDIRSMEQVAKSVLNDG